MSWWTARPGWSISPGAPCFAIDFLCIVSDCTVRGIRTAGRIAALAAEMGTPVKTRGLLVNRVPDGLLPDGVQRAVEETGLPLLAIIPFDGNVAAMDAGGMAVGDIPVESLARQTVNQVMDSFFENSDCKVT